MFRTAKALDLVDLGAQAEDGVRPEPCSPGRGSYQLCTRMGLVAAVQRFRLRFLGVRSRRDGDRSSPGVGGSQRGRSRPLGLPSGPYSQPRLSPNGTQITYQALGTDGTTIWILRPFRRQRSATVDASAVIVKRLVLPVGVWYRVAHEPNPRFADDAGTTRDAARLDSSGHDSAARGVAEPDRGARG